MSAMPAITRLLSTVAQTAQELEPNTALKKAGANLRAQAPVPAPPPAAAPATAPAAVTGGESPALVRLRERIETERLNRELRAEQRASLEENVTPFNRARRIVEENRDAVNQRGRDAFNLALEEAQNAGLRGARARRFAEQKLRAARNEAIRELLEQATDPETGENPFANADTGEVVVPRPRPNAPLAMRTAPSFTTAATPSSLNDLLGSTRGAVPGGGGGVLGASGIR